MKTILILLLMTANAWSAQLLVQAKDSPFEKGAKRGDVICVRGDDHVWGREETLPNYVVIKLPDVKEADVKYLEELLTEQVEVTKDNGGVLEGGEDVKEYRSELIRIRKYAVPVTDVDTLKSTATTVKTVPIKSTATYLSAVSVKDIAVEKALIAEAVAIKEADEISK